MSNNSVKIILNLGQWFRRFRLKEFLSGGLAALLCSGAEPFMQFWKRASWGKSLRMTDDGRCPSQ